MKAICSLSLQFVGSRVLLRSSNKKTVACFLRSILSKAPRPPQFGSQEGGGCGDHWVLYLLKPAFSRGKSLCSTRDTPSDETHLFFFLFPLGIIKCLPITHHYPPTSHQVFVIFIFTPLFWKPMWVWEGVLEFRITYLTQSQIRISVRQYFSTF